MPPTITATGGELQTTVNVTGTLTGDVTVFVAPINAAGWDVGGTRSGDGPVVVPLIPGYYVFYASLDSDGIPSNPAFAGVESDVEAVYTQVRAAMKVVIGMLTFPYTDHTGAHAYTGLIESWSELIAHNLRFPCIVMTKARVTPTSESRLNSTNDVGYPVRFMIVDRRAPGDETMTAAYDLWIQKLARAFDGAQLPTPRQNWICRVEYEPVASEGGEKFEFMVTELVVRAICREPRGINV